MPKLVIKQGPGKGDAFEMSRKKVTIGRDAQNSFRLADTTVSRYHAKVARENSTCFVSDLDSQNGTLVNGERISQRKLNHMDEIRLGNVVLIFLEDEVTDMDVLIESDESEPEITQAIDLDRGDILEGMSDGTRNELITSNQRLVALTSLAQNAASIKSLPSLFDLLINSLKKTLQPDRTVPIVHQEDGTLLPYIRARSGFDRGLEESGISKRLVEHCLKKGVAVLSHRATEKPNSSKNVTSTLSAPLVGKKVHGVIYCDRVGQKDKYQRSDLQYLCSVAAQVAVAMENIRAYEDVADRARSLESEVEGQYNLVGQSPEIKEVFEFIRKAAPTDAGVLICGESGTGKELVARAIHYNSKRGDGPFEAVNCAAMSQTLIESELFGHLKGSFTGAVNDRPGRFELAHEGTIFLDEIGALPLECQTKLLRVLEMGTLRRVGDVKDRKVDVRVIAATNEDLDKAKEEGSFREDLFYRLDVLRADLPTLRDRGDDIELLAQHFLREFSEKTGRTIRGFDPEVLNVFRDYRWPGNVRELKNVVERMVIMCEDDVLGPDLLPAELRGRQAVAIPQPGGEKMPEALESLGELEKNYIKEVLRKTDGNKKKTAEILGIDRSTLYAKLKKYAEEN